MRGLGDVGGEGRRGGGAGVEGEEEGGGECWRRCDNGESRSVDRRKE